MLYRPVPQPAVEVTPPELMTRQFAEWQGFRAEIVTAKQLVPFDYRFKSDVHLLVAAEHSERDDGETVVEGLPTSNCRHISRRLTFVPAGHGVWGWQEPRTLWRVNYFYIDPKGPLLDGDLHFDEVAFQPRLFFFDEELWRLSLKLRDAALNRDSFTHYGEALGVLLGHELVRLNGGHAPGGIIARGGLSGRQRKRVADFIEEHVADEIRLSALAQLVDLSPYHFARAFKQSFGLSPHRYHLGRRIDFAKTLLDEPARSVTEIARAVGFAETSSFSAAFRKLTGTSPRDYRRGALS
jgi:AraC family transcriptional regulator